MTVNQNRNGALSLSAQRALLGRIHTSFRLVKVRFIENLIELTVILDKQPSEEIVEDISEAGTEIVADFSECTITERIEINNEKLKPENIFDAGWVFLRKE